MADAGAIRAGKAAIEASLDDSKAMSGLQRLQAKLSAWGASVSAVGVRLAAAGGAITAPLMGAALLYTNTASSLGKMSQRTGIAAEDLSALQYAAKRSGLSVEELETGLRKMQVALDKAGQGGAQARQTLSRLGLSLKALDAQSADKQLASIADTFKSMPDGGEKSALAVQLFGRSGTQLIPFLNKGRAGIAALAEEGRRLGVVLGGEDVRTAKEFKGVMAQLQAAATGVGLAIGRAVIPGMTHMRNLIMPLVEHVTRFARENAGLFDTLFDVGTAVTAAGVGLTVLGKLLPVLLTPVTMLVAGLGALKAVAVAGFGVFASVFYAVLSPVGLCAVAVAGLVTAFLYLTDVGARVREILAGAFSGLLAIFRETWAGVVDAVKAGDLVLASRIVWAGVKVVWYEGVAALKEAWVSFLGQIKAMWENFRNYFQYSWLYLKVKVGATSMEDAVKQFREINAGTAADRAARRQQEDARLAGVRDEADAARAELAKLNKQALSQRLVKEAAKIEHDFPAERRRRLSLGESVGGFGAAVGRFTAGGGPGLAQQMVDEQQTTNTKLDQVLDELRQGGRFG